MLTTQPCLTPCDKPLSASPFTLPERGVARIGFDGGCDIRVEAFGVEPVHCEIERKGLGWLLRDLGGDRGTLVNGQRISTKTLVSGDVIDVGGVLLRFDHAPSRRDVVGRIEYRRNRLATRDQGDGDKHEGNTRVLRRGRVASGNHAVAVDCSATVAVNQLESADSDRANAELAAAVAESARVAAVRAGRQTRVWTAGGGSDLMVGPSRRVVVARACDGVSGIGGSISGALRQSLAVDRLRQALDTIYRVSNLVLVENDLDGLFGAVMDVIMDTLAPDRAFLLTTGKSGTSVRIARRSKEASRTEIEGESAGPSLSLVQACIDENLAVITEDAQLDPRFAAHSSVQSLGIRSAMCAPLRSASRGLGAIYVDRVASRQSFHEGELDLLAAIGRQAGLAVERSQAHDEKEQMFLSCVRALVNAIEAKDVYTSGHSERVASHAMSIAEVLGVDQRMADAVRLGALLHDIGKIGVPEHILLNPGRLSNDEFEIIKTHPARGAEILDAIEGIEAVKAAVRWHHEAVNGRGYPDRLAGDGIPMPARIVAVADAFDAMTSHRAYRRNLSVAEAVSEFKRCAGTQFDAEVCDAMVSLLESGQVLPSSDLDERGIDVRTRIYSRKAG